MDRPLDIKTILLFIISLTVVFFSSCGPRSGIHNDNADNSNNDKPKVCGNAIGNSSTGHKLFKINCAVCHTSHTDQKLTGPGLKGVFDRVPSEEWFIAYTINCDSVLKAGDKYAKKLRNEYKDQRMTNFSGHLAKADAEAIVAYLKNSSY